MISTAAVYQRVSQLLKAGTSGYGSDVEFTNDMYSTFLDILNTLCDNVEMNEKVSDMLSKEGLLVTTAITTSATGTFPYPTGHYRSYPIWKVGANINYPVTKININEVAMYETSPIRKADASKNLYRWYLTNGIGNIMPKAATPIMFSYVIKPAMPVLVLTLDDNDYEAVGAGTTDIKLPENLFNLFVYKMLERMSVEQKENIALEYSQLGISKEPVD